jgi:hypothetical protein
LPEGSLIVGVDEHTALLCDLAAGTASVVGNGGLTLRRNGSSVRYESGSVLPLSLDAPEASAPVVPRALVTGAESERPPSTSLRSAADEIEERFAAALAARDLDGCVSATLDLEQIITDWTADTNASDDADHARGLLRSMVLRLGDLAVRGLRDPREIVSPFVEALLRLRSRAREQRDFATSDQVRDALTAAGIEVRDTPDGPQWILAGDPARSGSA